MPAKTPGPSVKDAKTYEALRDDGASKEKAARIANAGAQRNRSRSSVAKEGGKGGSYDDWTVADLRQTRQGARTHRLLQQEQVRADITAAEPLTAHGSGCSTVPDATPTALGLDPPEVVGDGDARLAVIFSCH